MTRPIVILGAGVLGRRIASVFIAGGYTVHIRDPSPQALKDAATFIDAHHGEFTAITPKHPASGTYATFTEIPPAVQNAWLVIEAVPEKLDLKISTFAEVDKNAPADCIIASNSSSFKSRLMLDGVRKERRERVMNMHFTMPPGIHTVELMTCGETKTELFGELSEVLNKCGMVPVTARRESTGFIFNRLWASIKREILFILAEDVSTAEEIDLLWKNMFQLPQSLPPCQLMDKIGLDTVAFIEDNYIQERRLDGAMTVDWLRENYIKEGRLGLKSEKGGLYGPAAAAVPDGVSEVQQQPLYLLDVGLGSNNSDIKQIPTAGRILRFDPATKIVTTLVSGQSLPDGIDISRSAGWMFWTNMGRATSTHDGSVHSAKLDGTGIQTLLPSGTVHTPKQLVVDDVSHKIYFCDREGMGVHRCNFDGSQHEILIKSGNLDCAEHRADMTRWCVGITIDTSHGYVYWTQKGPSKAGKGRIFRAGLEIPAGETAENRTDIELLLDGLPEPIDLELDEKSQQLYWTDRGEHPTGCSLNSVNLGGPVKSKDLKNQKEILARHFNEPIGLKLGVGGEVYVGDLGGSVHCVKDGKKTVLHRDDGCYTGISL
ncbi:hypothetical protein N7460_009571 [Penicillium canescens]|uniref:Uncharacterized protein n=1 Tax=Penicillium canescens TaxID=5083 RepID=A0AAD6I991_PENCN|nr:hypothetical protein N7460_009571 [Penicillium canescens]KAJ6037523.1 hypothetical protein N7444_010228 [Penicillium canescens]